MSNSTRYGSLEYALWNSLFCPKIHPQHWDGVMQLIVGVALGMEDLSGLNRQKRNYKEELKLTKLKTTRSRAAESGLCVFIGWRGHMLFSVFASELI